MIIVITTCKGRLDHLKLSLPRFTEQFEKTVVVDYSCPDGTKDYAAEVPKTYIEYVRATGFHKTHALNVGAERAIAEGATRLCFLDADTLIHPGLRGLLDGLPENSMAITGPKTFRYSALLGFLCVSVKAYLTVQGYDEKFKGWGYEDLDMRLRLYCDAGCNPAHIPEEYFYAIKHGTDRRTEYQPDGLIEGAKRNQSIYKASLRSRLHHWSTELKECLPYR